MGDWPINMPFVVQSVENALKSEAFAEDLAGEIEAHPSRIGLDEYCKNGGSIGDVQVEDLEIVEIYPNGVARGEFSISFEESYHNGCRDITWSEDYAGTMIFELNFATRELMIVSEEIERVVEEDCETVT